MGRRRKKYKRMVKRVKRIPDIFQCPRCGNKSLTIKFEKSDVENYKLAVITCGMCGLKYSMLIEQLYEAVDVYARFIDDYDSGRITLEESNTSTGESGE